MRSREDFRSRKAREGLRAIVVGCGVADGHSGQS